MPPAADMPAAEVDVDASLVRSLLAEQHPDLADLPLTPLAFGWDNAVLRLGDDLVVRLPRRAMAAPLVEHEQRWLPALAPTLPLPVPVPRRVGRPSAALGYPWSWSVCPWLAGDVAGRTPPDDLLETARTLGAFVRALHQPAPPDFPPNPYRGGPLAEREPPFRDRLVQLADVVDGPSLLARWERLLTTPPWTGPPIWLHGDLHPANLLVHDGRISAVIDFGDLTAGDPASDLFVAWMLFPPAERAVFRAAAGDVDDDTWHRAEAWALLMAVAYLANSADNPLMTSIGHRALAALDL
jgi:aminoglycoside phosphotransferase (APT) family kinase protein